ncbi:Dyp-type peroxidase [Oleiharenicola lentus]|uniref:Dyp-type peroxidase n=1 Tax=Oleiharenicola lentus TaxID=2508720 RepID=UPI003F680634
MTLINDELQFTDIQGNILKGHGREFTALVIFRFGGDRAKNRELLVQSANPHWEHRITSAFEQEQQADKRRKLVGLYDEKSAQFLEASTLPFRSLGLTAAGLEACGIKGKELANPGEMIGMEFERISAFQSKDLKSFLRDPEPWEQAYQSRPHGVWLLANADETLLGHMVDACRRMLTEEYQAEVVGVENGFQWKPHKDGNQKNISYEPFGFADGFATTQIKVQEKPPFYHLVQPSSGSLKPGKARSFEIPIEQVMYAGPGPLVGSSFLVLRKLGQNVRAFLEAERALQPHLPPELNGIEAGAFFIGRLRNGAATLYPKLPLADRFDFNKDEAAKGCPFHAHIRKMNPRQNRRDPDVHPMAGRKQQKEAQFVRRGVVFGPLEKLRVDWPSPEAAPTDGVGLLFMGYMTSLGGQFMQMHLAWAPEKEFPVKGGGVDPLFATEQSPQWAWPQHTQCAQSFSRFVTPLGGAFFLVPSLRWLRGLA